LGQDKNCTSMPGWDRFAAGGGTILPVNGSLGMRAGTFVGRLTF